MPEMNPYESPQSDLSHQRHSPPSVEPEYPSWINTALNVQYMLILTLLILALFTSGPPGSYSFAKILAIAAILGFAGLIPILLVVAFRYRIRWLLFNELFVLFILGLPLLSLLG